MDYPDLIATLIPTDPRKVAENAFLFEENRARYLEPSKWIADGPTSSRREATPAQEQLDEDGDEYDTTHRIRLRFTDKLQNPAKGIAFGCDPDQCDVLLPYKARRAISSLHFCITFNEGGRLILNDSSTCGTAVSYDGQAKDEVRRKFTWILDLKKEERHNEEQENEEEKGKWNVEVHVPDKEGLAFKVQLASHDTCQSEYEAYVNKFLAASRDPLAAANTLNIKSPERTEPPSQSLSPRGRPVYIRERKLGSGAFASVYKLIDVSTGCVYAGKYFRRSKQPKAVWLEVIRREVRIMSNIRHVSKACRHEMRSSNGPKGPPRACRRLNGAARPSHGHAVFLAGKPGRSAANYHDGDR